MISESVPSGLTAYAFRLAPGSDLRQSLLGIAARGRLKGAVVVTCVGSLTDVCLRYANRPDGASRRGHFEIVSLVGTFSETGGHFHLSVADELGAMSGGHLLDGSVVYTTAEVVIVELTEVQFDRHHDAATGSNELVVTTRPWFDPLQQLL